MAYPEKKKGMRRNEMLRHVKRATGSFPETKLHNLPKKYTDLLKRRAKNKRAKQARKVNR